MTSKSSVQQSLFPPEFYLHRIEEMCHDEERLNNVVKLDELIRITPLLNNVRTILK